MSEGLDLPVSIQAEDRNHSQSEQRAFNKELQIGKRWLGAPRWLSGKEPACQCRRHETHVQSLGREDLLEKGMATHSSILAWRIPWTEEPGGLQSMGSHRVRHD